MVRYKFILDTFVKGKYKSPLLFIRLTLSYQLNPAFNNSLFLELSIYGICYIYQFAFFRLQNLGKVRLDDLSWYAQGQNERNPEDQSA